MSRLAGLTRQFLSPVGPGPEQKSAGRAGPEKIFAVLSHGTSGTGKKIAGLSRPLPSLTST